MKPLLFTSILKIPALYCQTLIKASSYTFHKTQEKLINLAHSIMLLSHCEKQEKEKIIRKL
jgi:hypothetical protein